MNGFTIVIIVFLVLLTLEKISGDITEVKLAKYNGSKTQKNVGKSKTTTKQDKQAVNDLKADTVPKWNSTEELVNLSKVQLNRDKLDHADAIKNDPIIRNYYNRVETAIVNLTQRLFIEDKEKEEEIKVLELYILKTNGGENE